MLRLLEEAYSGSESRVAVAAWLCWAMISEVSGDRAVFISLRNDFFDSFTAAAGSAAGSVIVVGVAFDVVIDGLCVGFNRKEDL